MNTNFKFYFEKTLAEFVASQYQHLLGKTFQVSLGESTIDVPIDFVTTTHIEEDGYDIILASKLENIDFREIYQVMNLDRVRLLEYLELNNETFPFERYGIGFCQLIPERDENGDDLYL